MRHTNLLSLPLLVGALAFAQAQEPAAPAATEPTEPAQRAFHIEPGTKIPLGLLNSVSTKSAEVGDRVYLESIFPVMVDGRIVIPPGSYIAGTVTQVKRPGRMKGRGELYVRFDSLTLPNGVTRDFRARMGSLDGRANAELDRTEGVVRSEGNKGGDARTVGEGAAAGASVGAIAGSVAGRAAMGAGIGAAAGATAGLIGVLLTRGPEAVLAKGSTLEMVLDRRITYLEDEIANIPSTGRRQSSSASDGPAPTQKRSGVPIPGRRLPY